MKRIILVVLAVSLCFSLAAWKSRYSEDEIETIKLEAYNRGFDSGYDIGVEDSYVDLYDVEVEWKVQLCDELEPSLGKIRRARGMIEDYLNGDSPAPSFDELYFLLEDGLCEISQIIDP